MKKKVKKLGYTLPRILILEGLWSDTAKAVQAAGGLTTELTPWEFEEVQDELLSGLYDGMILTGGGDINPELYGQVPVVQTQVPDGLRDATELMALDAARELGIPVLGICRGSQIMCAHNGGSLCQHIGYDHTGSSHEVYAAATARTFKRACNSRHMSVTSLHHQCVSDPGKGMRIAAYAKDGTPEAIESIDGRMLGCQFHPELEWDTNANAFHIFKWLVKAAARKAGGTAKDVPFRSVRARRQNAPVPGSHYRGTPDAPWQEAEDEMLSHPLKEGKHRQAGDPSLPSARQEMRTLTRIAESARYDVEGTVVEARASDELSYCRECGMLFDSRRDRNDHEKYLHGNVYPTEPISMEEYYGHRYGDPEPPDNSPAWDDNGDADNFEAMLARHGIH